MACKKCGAELPEGMDCCSKCGGGTDNSQCGGEVLELPQISLNAIGKRDAKKPPILVLCILGMALAGIIFHVGSGGRRRGAPLMAGRESGSGTAGREAEATVFPGDGLPGTDALEYPVHINVYMAEGDRGGAGGSWEGDSASGAVIILREGADVREGETFRTLQAEEGGRIDTTLPSGTYTAQIDVPGCVRSFQEIRVEKGETSADSYVKWQKRLVRVDYSVWDLDFRICMQVASHVYAYDSWGNLSEETCQRFVDGYHCDNDNIRTSYLYDSQGHLMQRVEYDIWGSRQEVYYDNQGNLTKSVNYDSDGSIWAWTENSYDNQGNLTKSVDYGRDSSISSWIENSYDNQGNLIKSVDYDRDGSIRAWHENGYDSQGNLTKSVYYDRDGSIRAWHENSYDSYGNLAMRANYFRHYDATDLYGQTYECYDSQGRVVRSVYIPEHYGGRHVWDVSYEYDNQGNLTKQTQTNYPGPEYDVYGNLITSSGSDSVDYYTEYRNEYDSWGRLVRSLGYRNGSDLSHRRENTYDDLGNLMREAVYDEIYGVLRLNIEKIYDDQGNIMEETKYDAYRLGNSYGNLWESTADGPHVTFMKTEYLYE